MYYVSVAPWKQTNDKVEVGLEKEIKRPFFPTWFCIIMANFRKFALCISLDIIDKDMYQGLLYELSMNFFPGDI